MTHPDSLHGRAWFIRNLLRGGEPTDDDSFPLALIADAIVTLSGEVRQAELDALERQSDTPPSDWYVRRRLTLADRPAAEACKVVVRQAPLPLALRWKGQPAVLPPRTRESLPSWGYAPTADYAVRLASGAPYAPPKPVYWLEPGTIAVALPLRWSGIYEAAVDYIPARIDTGLDGTALDPETDPLPLRADHWARVWPLVLQRLGQPLLASSAARDDINDGMDVKTS